MVEGARSIVIVGGGTAGWLSACYLAARADEVATGARVTLIEAPDIPSIGVGEGTWPTMRETLSIIGLDEAEFLRACDGSLKQGSRFDGWVTGDAGDSYLHPFTAPPQAAMKGLLGAWLAMPDEPSFASVMTAQERVCAQHLAPRQVAMPGYAGALNYAYHLDAAKLAATLASHAVDKLGVIHIADTVTLVAVAGERITALETAGSGTIEADLFIDCSGLRAILIGDALGVEWEDLAREMLNDRAIAVQLPTNIAAPVASQTVATAHSTGWIWDIALPTRRGIGCVYSSRYCTDNEAMEALRSYVLAIDPAADLADLSPRAIVFPSGHRRAFWKGNCIAIGLSAGFIEPLEASAIVLIELSLRALADNFPTTDEAMPLYAERFNCLFALRWRRIADFLKLHYALSRRDEPYWRAQRDPATMSPELTAHLKLWRDQPPSSYDFPLVDEIFPAASQQYVYYGMRGRPTFGQRNDPEAVSALAQVRERARQLSAALPTNRAYLDRLRGGGTDAIPAREAAG